jgi:hypothetical protein
MRKRSYRVHPRVESMESRALLSALGPVSTSHDLESRALVSPLASVSTPNQLDTGVAEVRSGSPRNFPRTSVRIYNNTRMGLTIDATAILKEGNRTVDRDQKDVHHGGTMLFTFKKPPNFNANWYVQIVLKGKRQRPIPPTFETPLSRPSIGNPPGYYGNLYTVTLTGNTFNVCCVATPT